MAIQSSLIKSAMLAQSSRYFRTMVRAACWHVGVTYADAVVEFVAIQPSVVAPLTLEPNQDIDSALLNLLESYPNAGAAVDATIVDAVQAYRDAQLL